MFSANRKVNIDILHKNKEILPGFQELHTSTACVRWNQHDQPRAIRKKNRLILGIQLNDWNCRNWNSKCIHTCRTSSSMAVRLGPIKAARCIGSELAKSALR